MLWSVAWPAGLEEGGRPRRPVPEARSLARTAEGLILHRGGGGVVVVLSYWMHGAESK